jgi:hypothetical protein
MKINRLIECGVAVLQYTLEDARNPNIKIESKAHAVRVSIDVNTDSDNLKLIEPNKQIGLFDELANFLKEIAYLGDRK